MSEKKQYKAFNAFIFAGSFSIGVMDAGFDLRGVLEITDDMIEKNAYYFHKNYPHIPVVPPSKWDNEKFMLALQKANIDLMCCNCPCSSLSQINRNASVEGKNNVHFYRLFNIFKQSQPKVFVIENAPTLIKLGFPILKDMVNELKDIYTFTIIKDQAGNHNVPMQRARTLVVGWRKDYFKQHPIVNADPQPKMTIGDTLKDIINDTTDDCKSKQFDCLSSLYKYVKNKQATVTGIASAYLEGDEKTKVAILTVVSKTKQLQAFKRIVQKIRDGKSFFDKSPYREGVDGRFQSFSSVQEYLHPTQNRTLNMKELQRIMTYPDSFDFTGTCKIPVRQAMAQGVPVNFGKYIATQAKLGLDGALPTIDADVVFQDNTKKKYDVYSYDSFIKLDGLEISKDGVSING